ncbi:MAG: M48 family metalloprotease [Alphaproteobacteria bacterium]
MAFDPTLPLAATGPGLWSRLSGLVRGLLAPAPWSPEEDLSLTPHIDPRLVPRAKMSAEEIDAGALLRLSGLGLRHGKLITAESHPELNAAWNAMCARAGLPRPRQLILCETDMVNAFTLPTGEVAVTTGMFKVLDLRETVAMLGHELGHARHARPEHMHRIATDAVYTGVGAVVGSGVGVLWDSYALEHHTGWMSRFLRPRPARAARRHLRLRRARPRHRQPHLRTSQRAAGGPRRHRHQRRPGGLLQRAE